MGSPYRQCQIHHQLNCEWLHLAETLEPSDRGQPGGFTVSGKFSGLCTPFLSIVLVFLGIASPLSRWVMQPDKILTPYSRAKLKGTHLQEGCPKGSVSAGTTVLAGAQAQRVLGDQVLLPRKHPQGAFLERRGPSSRQGSRAIRAVDLGIKPTWLPLGSITSWLCEFR